MSTAEWDDPLNAAAPDRRPVQPAGRIDALALLALLALGVGLPLVLGVISGSLEVPRNDDWAYRRLALDFARTGQLQLSVTTMILGQILIVQPLLVLSGLQPWAFTVAGITFAICAVLAAYALARQFLAPRRATLAVALLLLFPGYLAYATSFMSDLPAIALQYACLALGVVALRDRPVRDRWLVASVVMGCLALTFRDFALAAPAAVLVGAVCIEPRRLRYWLLGASCVGWYALLYALRTSLRSKDLVPGTTVGSPLQSVQALTIIAMVLLPAVLLALLWRHRDWHRAHVVLGLEVGLILAAGLVVWFLQGSLAQVFLPNLASRWGAPQREMFLGVRPPLIGDAGWELINLIALAAAVLLIAVLTAIAGVQIRTSRSSRATWVRHAASPVGLLALFSLAVIAGLGIYGSVNVLYDRYYWPVIPTTAIVLLRVARGAEPAFTPRLRRAGRGIVGLSGSSIALLAILSLGLALNSNAFDAALWRAGNLLADQGVPRDGIDAGLTWVGYHATTRLTGGGNGPVFYRAYWPDFRQCGYVTSTPGPEAGSELVATLGYQLFLVAGPVEPLYVYRDVTPACKAG